MVPTRKHRGERLSSPGRGCRSKWGRNTGKAGILRKGRAGLGAIADCGAARACGAGLSGCRVEQPRRRAKKSKKASNSIKAKISESVGLSSFAFPSLPKSRIIIDIPRSGGVSEAAERKNELDRVERGGVSFRREGWVGRKPTHHRRAWQLELPGPFSFFFPLASSKSNGKEV